MSDSEAIPAAIEPIEAAGGKLAGSEAVRRRLATTRPPKPPTAAPEGEQRPDPTPGAGSPLSPASGATASGAETAPATTGERRGRPAGSKTKKRSGRKLTKTELRDRAREANSAKEQAETRERELRAQLDAERSRMALAIDPAEMREKRIRSISAACEAVYRFMARRRGSHWNLTKEDARLLGETTVDGVQAIRDILAPIVPMAAPIIDRVYDLAAPATAVGVHWAVWDERAERDERTRKGEPTGERIALVGAP